MPPIPPLNIHLFLSFTIFPLWLFLFLAVVSCPSVEYEFQSSYSSFSFLHTCASGRAHMQIVFHLPYCVSILGYSLLLYHVSLNNRWRKAKEAEKPWMKPGTRNLDVTYRLIRLHYALWRQTAPLCCAVARSRRSLLCSQPSQCLTWSFWIFTFEWLDLSVDQGAAFAGTVAYCPAVKLNVGVFRDIPSTKVSSS